MIRLYCHNCGFFAELNDYKSRERSLMNRCSLKSGCVCPCGAVTAITYNEVEGSPPPPNQKAGDQP